MDIAKTLRVPLSEALSHAIRRYQRDLFFERLETSFAGLTEQERERDQAELTAWDQPLSDDPESG